MVRASGSCIGGLERGVTPWVATVARVIVGWACLIFKLNIKVQLTLLAP